MKISLNNLNKFLDFDLKSIDITEIESKIGSQLGALEDETLAFGNLYDNIIVVEVVEASAIEGSDHLNFCQIDDGGAYSKADSYRNANGTINVVCGAPNVKKGIKVAWIPPSAMVPVSYFKEPFILESREIFSHISNGMLASGHELFVNNDASGLLVLDPSIKKGTSLKEVLELDDYILDIENKMFTHRPDCFGLVGVAREVSGIFHKSFKSPSWYKSGDLKLNIPKKLKYDLAIQIENKELVKRFSSLILSNVKIGPSPLKVQSYLIRQGLKPINNVVDATNLVMLETAQPLHAYDLVKIRSIGPKIELTARNAKENEKLKLINQKEVILNPTNLVISSNNKAVALAGVMGGLETEIDQSTTEIILESANFDMYSIRRSSMNLGIFSDSVTRFNKGQSALQTKMALFRLVELIKDFSESDVYLSSDIVDLNLVPKDIIKNNSLANEISINLDFINERLGTNLELKTVTSLLENVEFKVKSKSNNLIIKAPFYRTDIEIKEDIIEEVGRLYGYQEIKLKPIKRSIRVSKLSELLEFKQRIRSNLKNLGLNEIISYSYYSENDLLANNLNKNNSFEIANPISPKLKYFRQNISGSLASKIHPNIKIGFNEFGLYEFGQIFLRNKEFSDSSNVSSNLAVIYANKKDSPFSPYYSVKNIYKDLIDKMYFSSLRLVKINSIRKISDLGLSFSASYDSDRSAFLVNNDDQIVGVVGEFSPRTIEAYKLPFNCAGLEINLDLLLTQPAKLIYFPTSKYPTNKQDLTLKVPLDMPYGDLKKHIFQEFELLKEDNISLKLEPLSIFKAKDSINYKNITFRLLISDLERTLPDQYINNILDKLVHNLKDKINAERI